MPPYMPPPLADAFAAFLPDSGALPYGNKAAPMPSPLAFGFAFLPDSGRRAVW